MHPRVPCFNEARADSPGKYRLATTGGCDRMGHAASMRPGLIRPGNIQPQPCECRIPCGGFNEARADSPGKSYPRSGCKMMPHLRGFNEARADSPGKFEVANDVVARLHGHALQ